MMSKRILLTLLMLMLTPIVSLTAVPGDNIIQGRVDLTSVPHKIIWTIETAFLSEISSTQDDGYLIDGQYTSIQDITGYISRDFLLPIPEAGALSYHVDGKIGAEPEILIPVSTFTKAGTALISVYQHSQGALDALWLQGFITFTVTFTPDDGKLPSGYTLPEIENGRVPVPGSGMQSLQLPAMQKQFDDAYAAFITGRDQWAGFFNANLRSRQTKRITEFPGISGTNAAEKTVSWIEVKFSGVDVQQLSSTLDKLGIQRSVPYLSSDVNTLLNWGSLLIDKAGPFQAVLAGTAATAASLSTMLTSYAYNIQAGGETDFNFEKNRLLIRALLDE